MLGQVKERNIAVLECIHVDLHGKGVSNGLCYLDSTTVNLQVQFFIFFVLYSTVLAQLFTPPPTFTHKI